MTDTTMAVPALIKPIVDFLPAIQQWMNDNIKTEADKKTSQDIYDGLPELAKVKFTSFQVGVSKAITEGYISGFEGRKGRNGGYVPAGTPKAAKALPTARTATAAPTTADNDDPGEGHNLQVGTIVQVTPTVRLRATDRYNWGLEYLSGNTWVNRGWYKGLESAINVLAMRMVDEKIRASIGLTEEKCMEVGQLIKAIREAKAETAAMVSALPVEEPVEVVGGEATVEEQAEETVEEQAAVNE